MGHGTHAEMRNHTNNYSIKKGGG